jgi:hypothetical protein
MLTTQAFCLGSDAHLAIRLVSDLTSARMLVVVVVVVVMGHWLGDLGLVCANDQWACRILQHGHAQHRLQTD